MKFLKKYWYLIAVLIITLGLGILTFILSNRLSQTKPVTPATPKASTAACTLTFALPIIPTPTCSPAPACINTNGLPYQNIRQVFLNDAGTKVYYRTCKWDPSGAAPFDCSPADNSFNEQDIINITEANNPSYRQYGVFVYDAKDASNNPIQNVRQYYIDRTGTKVYYRTCRWDNVRGIADNCNPSTGWTSLNISNVTGTGDTSYRAYRAFIFDVPGQTPWPQSIRQIYLNEAGTRVIYRTCQWNHERGAAENCNPANGWTTLNVTDAIDPQSVPPGQTSIRDFMSFVYDTKDANGNKIQKIRQSYVNSDGTYVYYRTCTWNPQTAAPENCSPAAPGWSAISVGAAGRPVNSPVSKFFTFIYDTNCSPTPPGGWCPVPPPVRPTPTPTCTPRPVCLDAVPPARRCFPPEPDGGWCPGTTVPTPTSSPTPTPTPLASCNNGCNSTNDCTPGLVCSGGACRNPACTDQIGCTCPVATTTLAPTPTPLASCNNGCNSTNDCKPGLVCSGGACRNPACTDQIGCTCPVATTTLAPTPTPMPGVEIPTPTPPTPKIPVSGNTGLLGGVIIGGGILLLLLGLAF